MANRASHNEANAQTHIDYERELAEMTRGRDPSEFNPFNNKHRSSERTKVATDPKIALLLANGGMANYEFDGNH